MNIKKTVTLLIAMILFLAMPLFAYQDTFKASSTRPSYVKVISAIKNGDSEANVLKAYNDYINDGISPVERCRIEYHLARYYKDNSNKDKAKEHISLMGKLFNALPSNTSEFEKLVCNCEYTSADFYVTRDLSVGLKNSNIAKELYKKYPDEVFSNMNEAWRLIYTPAIAGGSPRKAIQLLDKLTKAYAKNLTMLDEYSIDCAYAIAYNAREDYENADTYFKKAFKFFPNETEIVASYKDNVKALEKANN